MNPSLYQLNMLARAFIDGKLEIKLGVFSMYSIEELLINKYLMIIQRGCGFEINHWTFEITEKGVKFLADQLEFD